MAITLSLYIVKLNLFIFLPLLSTQLPAFNYTDFTVSDALDRLPCSLFSKKIHEKSKWWSLGYKHNQCLVFTQILAFVQNQPHRLHSVPPLSQQQMPVTPPEYVPVRRTGLYQWHKLSPGFNGILCLLSADFPAGTRHVFSLSTTDYYHTLVVDSQDENIMFLGAV